MFYAIRRTVAREAKSRRAAATAVSFEALEPRLHLHGEGLGDHDHGPSDPAIDVQHEDEADHTIFDHVHYTLVIFIEDQRVVIPPNIGVGANGVLEFTHTHAPGVESTNDDPFGGFIHIHPIGNQLPTHLQSVGDFFEVWRTNAGVAGNEPDALFNEDQIFTFVANDEFRMRMYVRHAGESRFELNDEYENYVPHDMDEVVIRYELLETIIRIGEGGRKSVTFTDGDGTKATITMKTGFADVSFDGMLVSVLPDDAAVVVGQDLRVTSINMGNTTDKSTLTVKAKGGDGAILIGDMNTTGSMNAIAAKAADFDGTIDIAGSLKKFDARNLTGVQLNVDASADPKASLSVSFVNAVDTGIDSGVGVKSVKGESWTNQDGDVEELQAPWLGALTVEDESEVNLDLTGANAPKGLVLKTAKVGTIAGGTWTGTGDAGAIAATDILAGWVATFTGVIKSIKVANNAAGAIQAAGLQALQVKNNLTGADFLLTMAFNAADVKAKLPAMKSFMVGGTVQNTTLRSNAHLGAFQAGRFLNTTIFAGVLDGVAADDLPDAGDFEHAAQIKSVTVKGIKGQAVSMQSANFAASVMGKVKAINAVGDDPRSAFTASAFAGFQYAGANGTQKLDKPALVTIGETMFDDSLLVRVV